MKLMYIRGEMMEKERVHQLLQTEIAIALNCQNDDQVHPMLPPVFEENKLSSGYGSGASSVTSNSKSRVS